MTERKTKDAERKSNVGKVCVVKTDASQRSAKQGANAAELGLYYTRLVTRKQEKKPFFSAVKKEKRNEKRGTTRNGAPTRERRQETTKRRFQLSSENRTKIENDAVAGIREKRIVNRRR